LTPCLIQQKLVEKYKSIDMRSDIFIPEVDKFHRLYVSKLKEELKNNKLIFSLNWCNF